MPFTTTGADRILRGIVAGTIHVALHTGSPSATNSGHRGRLRGH